MKLKTSRVRSTIIGNLLWFFIVAAGLSGHAACHAHGGEGRYHGHGYHGGGEYHGHGGYYRRGGGYWGGSWGRPWYPPAVVIGVPFGGYYAYPEPVCSIIQQCYPDGECIETEVCD